MYATIFCDILCHLVFDVVVEVSSARVFKTLYS